MGNGNSHSSETALSASSKLQHLVVEPDAVVNSSPSDIPRSVSSECPVIRRLILHRNEKLDDVIFVVKKGWNLQFVLGSSLCSSNVRLFLSHQSVGVDEELTQHELTWCKQHSHNVGSLLDDVQVFAETQVLTAGSFYYFFTVNGTDKQEDASGTGYFIVQPELKVGTLRTNIPLCGIVCQTVLSKNLGPFSDWLDRLIVAKKTGYNAIHFTPLQVSDCCVCLCSISGMSRFCFDAVSCFPFFWYCTLNNIHKTFHFILVWISVSFCYIDFFVTVPKEGSKTA